MSVDVYIARGSERNISRSVVGGVEKSLVESILGVSVPKEAIDDRGYVHLWGVPRSGAEKYWRSIKRGDIIIILPVRKSKKELGECYVTIVVDKYPVNVTQEEIERSEKLSRVIWEPYRRRQGIAESYPYIVFLDSRVSIESINDVFKILGKDVRSLAGYRESIQRIRGVPEHALQELAQRGYRVPDTSTILSLLEEVYLELSAKLGWNPVNCYHYSIKYGVCYGAPIPLGNKEVWGREGLFEELNKRLLEKRYRPITWELLKQLIKEITRPGVIWASWFSSVYTKQVEPHDITIMEPSFIKE
jgi:hypothetical protein